MHKNDEDDDDDDDDDADADVLNILVHSSTIKGNGVCYQNVG